MTFSRTEFASVLINCDRNEPISVFFWSTVPKLKAKDFNLGYMKDKLKDKL